MGKKEKKKAKKIKQKRMEKEQKRKEREEGEIEEEQPTSPTSSSTPIDVDPPTETSNTNNYENVLTSFSYANVNNQKKRKRSKIIEELEEEEKQEKKIQKISKSEIVMKLDYFKGKNQCLSVKDIQNLILWALNLGTNIPWIFLKDKILIKKVVVISVGGLDYNLYKLYSHLFPSLSSFSKGGELRLPGSKTKCYPPLQTLLSHKQKNCKSAQMIAKKLNFDVKMEAKEIYHSAIEITLTEEQLKENLFPDVSSVSDSSGYISLPSSVSVEHYLLCIDCEMCITNKGSELTRVAVVDINGVVIFDTLVKPPNNIIDYLTKYSGITKEMMEGVTTTLEDVQTHLSTLISSSTILIGHSLENDLRALKIYHKKVIDTSVLYPHERGLPSKIGLRVLSRCHLNKIIQNNGNGHNPIEDALTCAQLTKLILLNGKKLKDFEEGWESLFDHIYSSNNQLKSVMIDRRSAINQFVKPPNIGFPVLNDDDVINTICNGKIGDNNNNDNNNDNDNDNNENNKKKNGDGNNSKNEDKKVKDIEGLLVTQLFDLQYYFGENRKEKNEEYENEEKFVEVCSKLDQSIQTILSSLLPNSLVILLTGQPNFRYFSEAKSCPNLNQNDKSPVGDKNLEQKVHKARRGICFFSIA